MQKAAGKLFCLWQIKGWIKRQVTQESSYTKVILWKLFSEELGMTEHNRFRSEDAEEKCLAIFRSWEKLHWPVESESLYINTSYGKTFVRLSGPKHAPPLFLLHGIGSNSLYWGKNIEELSEEFRTYAADTIDDYGLSINTVRMKDRSDHAKWLNELFTGLGLEDNINLIGYSYGGWIASQYALGFQKRLRKIIMVAPAGTIRPIVFQFYIRRILMLLPIRFFKESYFSWVDAASNDTHGFKEQIDFMETTVRCYRHNYSIVRPTVLTDEELRSIKCPALFLIGEREKIYSPQKAVDRLERVAPHIKKEIIPDTGHMSILRSPEINEKMLAFLKENCG